VQPILDAEFFDQFQQVVVALADEVVEVLNGLVADAQRTRQTADPWLASSTVTR
jgi:hypothetical protein